MMIRYEKSGNRFLDAIYPFYWLASIFLAIGISWGFMGDNGFFDSYPIISIIGAFISAAIIFGILHIIWRALVRCITGRKDYQGLP